MDLKLSYIRNVLAGLDFSNKTSFFSISVSDPEQTL